MADFKTVTRPIRKKDAMQLLTGQPVYTEDLMPPNALVVKLLRSPHPSAYIRSIKTDTAKKIPGIEGIWTYEDVQSEKRYTTAGQTYPEMSAHDRLLLDRQVRMIGDPVAIIAAENEAAAEKALKLIKVDYEILPPVLDFHTAKDHPALVHPEDNWEALLPFCGADNKRNLAAEGCEEWNDVDGVLDDCDIVLEDTFHCKANSQAMMETFRAFAQIDPYGRLHVTASTQIVFHARRIIAAALGIPKSKVRVSKPRIGGGFGAKQSVVAEVYPAFVTWKTKKPSALIYTREESQTAGSPRHEMELRVKMGADLDGTIRAIDLYTLSNTGAYSEHGPTTVDLSARKSIPLYTSSLEAYRFSYDVVYTNLQSAGAFRGYGAPQGIFAVETLVNMLADRLNMDPAQLRKKNMLKEGQIMYAYHGQRANACALDQCIKKADEMFGWSKKPNSWKADNGKIHAKGMALGMQGSGIMNVDVGSATLRLTEDGFYDLIVGSADMGTGSDTILAQMVCEMMDCEIDDVEVFSADTDVSPYDSGSYASSTTYVTGKAVEKACEQLQKQCLEIAAGMLKIPAENLEFTRNAVQKKDGSARVSLEEIATKSMAGNCVPVMVTATHSSPVSPPPYMVGMVEIELDAQTGEVRVVDYVGVADCGTVINENLARVQLEGGIAQGIGMALFEDIHYSSNGKIAENSLMQYKIPTRLDVGTIRTAFCSSYEPTGPFGAKSIGELVINTPCPAINHAIFHATGHFLKEVPFTPEKVWQEALRK